MRIDYRQLTRSLICLRAVLLVASILLITTSPQEAFASHIPNPIVQNGWTVYWQITADDGLAVYDVSYKGALVLKDARLAGVIVKYLGGGCFFYDEIGYDPPEPYPNTLTHGNISLTYPVSGGFNLTGIAFVPGYDYKQTWLFYPDGRFLALLKIGGGGCSDIHTYEIRWRLDFALGGDNGDTAHVYTNDGWATVRSETEVNDDGLRDTANTFTVWRISDKSLSYYFAPFDAPEAPTRRPRLLVVASYMGETVVYNNGPTPSTYDGGEPVIFSASGEAPPPGSNLKDDPRVKYFDSNSNNVWDPGEAVVYDSNNDNVYNAIPEKIEPVIFGDAPADGTLLKDDPKITYVDSKANGRWDPAEIENSHSPGLVNPNTYLDGERTYRANLAVWYVSQHTHDIHREVLFEEPILSGLIFYPRGF